MSNARMIFYFNFKIFMHRKKDMMKLLLNLLNIKPKSFMESCRMRRTCETFVLSVKNYDAVYLHSNQQFDMQNYFALPHTVNITWWNWSLAVHCCNPHAYVNTWRTAHKPSGKNGLTFIINDRMAVEKCRYERQLAIRSLLLKPKYCQKPIFLLKKMFAWVF